MFTDMFAKYDKKSQIWLCDSLKKIIPTRCSCESDNDYAYALF